MRGTFLALIAAAGIGLAGIGSASAAPANAAGPGLKSAADFADVGTTVQHWRWGSRGWHSPGASHWRWGSRGYIHGPNRSHWRWGSRGRW